MTSFGQEVAGLDGIGEIDGSVPASRHRTGGCGRASRRRVAASAATASRERGCERVADADEDAVAGTRTRGGARIGRARARAGTAAPGDSTSRRAAVMTSATTASARVARRVPRRRQCRSDVLARGRGAPDEGVLAVEVAVERGAARAPASRATSSRVVLASPYRAMQVRGGDRPRLDRGIRGLMGGRPGGLDDGHG